MDEDVLNASPPRAAHEADPSVQREDVWMNHLNIIRAEHTVNKSYVSFHDPRLMDHNDMDEEDIGAKGILSQIKHKGAPIHLVLKYHGRDIVVQFSIQPAQQQYFHTRNCSIPVFCFHAYTSDKTVSDNAILVIELNVIGFGEGCNNSTRECAMQRIVHYPNDAPSVGQLKTLIALDNDDEAIYARSLRSENDDQLLQMDLCVKITDNTRHMLSTVDTVFAAFEPRTPDES